MYFFYFLFIWFPLSLAPVPRCRYLLAIGGTSKCVYASAAKLDMSFTRSYVPTYEYTWTTDVGACS